MASRNSPVLLSPFKLRESCCNCAKSKLRCGREKPACARCSRLGKRCDYIPCRRPGRARAPSSESSERENANRYAPISKSMPSSVMAMESTTLSPSSPETPTIPGSYLYQGAFLESGSLTGKPSLSSPLGFEPLLFDIPKPPAGSSMINATGIAARNWEPEATTAYHGSNHHSTMTPTLMSNLPQNPTLDPSMGIGSSPSLVSPTVNTQPDVSTMPIESTLNSQCTCLMRAFKLLYQLSLKSSNDMVFSSTSGHPERRTSGHAEANSQSTRAMKEYLQDMISMVKCTCSEDPHLLSLKSLLAFKVMELYKVTSSGSEKGASANHYHLRQHMEFLTMEGQTFLPTDENIYIEELHLVRQLVGFLSSRLRRLVAGESRQEHANSNMHAIYHASATSAVKIPEYMEDRDSLGMPTGLLRQLEIDLRQGLRRIFVGIGEMGY